MGKPKNRRILADDAAEASFREIKKLKMQKQEVYETLHKKAARTDRAGWRQWVADLIWKEVKERLDAPGAIISPGAGQSKAERVLHEHMEEIERELNKRQVPYSQRRVAFKEVPLELFYKWRRETQIIGAYSTV